MNGDKIDKVLSEIYSEPIYPSEELIKKTKQSLAKTGLLECAVAISIILNLLVTIAFSFIILFGLHNILEKIALFVAVVFVQNVVLLVVCLNREKLKEMFVRIGMDII